MKRLLLCCALMGSLSLLQAQTVTYSTNEWSQTWNAGTSGSYAVTDGIGLYSYDATAGKGEVQARLFRSNGQTSGSQVSLRVGQKIRVTLALANGGGRTGINNGGRIGFSLRSSTDVYDPASPSSIVDRYDVNARFRLEFIGGNTNAQFEGGNIVSSNMPDFNSFFNGQTYELELVSDKEFNLVYGSTRYNLQTLKGTGSINQITIYNIGSNADSKYTNLQVETGSTVGLQANSGETFDVAGVISDGSSANNITKSGGGTVRLKGMNTFTGLTSVNVGTLQLYTANTIPSANNITVSSGGTLQVSADQTINSLIVNTGGTLVIDPGVTLTINGAFTGGGTIDNNGSLVLKGSSSFPGAGSTINTMSSLTIDRGAGNSIALDKNLTITGALTFTSGNLDLNGKALTLGSASSIAGSPATSSHIVINGGSVVRNGLNGSFTFPIGTSSASYSPVTISNTESYNWAVTVASGITQSSANAGRAVQRTWNIAPSAMPATGTTLAFEYNESDAGIKGDNWKAEITGVDVNHYNGTIWENLGAAGMTGSTGSIRTATITYPGGNSFSPFALSQVGTPLPVTFQSFSGKRSDIRNELKWITATESNNRGFEVERSGDGRSYASAGFVASRATAGNSTSELAYTFSDNAATGITWYYRLKQVDLDGRYKYSPVVKLTSEKSGLLVVDGVYPNPAKGSLQVRLQAGQASGNIVLQLSDIQGRVVKVKGVSVEAGAATTTSIDIEQLAAGVYHLRAISANGDVSEAVKVVKN